MTIGCRASRPAIGSADLREVGLREPGRLTREADPLAPQANPHASAC
jgi:hypothetical protein